VADKLLFTIIYTSNYLLKVRCIIWKRVSVLDTFVKHMFIGTISEITNRFVICDCKILQDISIKTLNKAIVNVKITHYKTLFLWHFFSLMYFMGLHKSKYIT
jgi:hypothetical protein